RSVRREKWNRRLPFCPGLIARSGEVDAVPNLPSFKLAQHGVQLPNLRVRSEWVPYAPTVHREKQFEFAVVLHRSCDLEWPCAQRLEYLRLQWKFSGHSQRPPFPNPVSPRSEPEEFPEKGAQALIQADNFAQHLVTEGDIQIATGKDNLR